MFGCALAVNGRLEEARGLLRAALDGLVEADHLGCVLHCMDSIAGLAATIGATDECRALLGLIGGIRRDLRRLRHSLEQYGYLEAIRLCGDVEPTTGDDLIPSALEVCDTLLGLPPTPINKLSRPTQAAH
jgi:hypothetical protein